MRLVTFELDGRQHFGIANDEAVTSLSSLALAHGADASFFTNIQRFLLEGERASDAARHLEERANRDWNEWLPLSKVHLSCPVPRPSKIVAIGLNYRDHAQEAKLTLPTEPLLFAKFPSSISGPFDPIVIPRANPDIDYEAELAVIIGSRAKSVKARKRFRLRRRIHGPQRCLRPQMAVRRQAVDPWKVLRHLLSCRTLAYHA